MSTTTHELDALATEVSRLKERLSESERKLKKKDKRIEELEDRVDQLESEAAENDARLDALGTGIESANDEIADLDDRVADVEQREPSGSNGQNTHADAEMTPIERVSRLEEDEHGIDVTPSVRRAAALHRNLADWGVKTPRGIVLKTKDGLKSLLSAATDESLSWKQIYRACRALDDLGGEDVEYHTDHSRHGRMLVLRTDESRCQPSSAAT